MKKKGAIFIRETPENFKLENSTIWSFPERGSWATHSGEYRGNWSPYIPRNIILRYSKKHDWILDQFLGSGTTLIEAKLLGRNAIGVDINSDQYNCWGVSQGSILTKKGEYLASLIGKDVLLNDIPYSLICKTNQGLFIPIPQRGNRKRFVNDYLIHSLHIASHSPMVKRANRHMAAKAKILRIIRGIKKLSKIMEKLLEIAKTK